MTDATTPPRKIRRGDPTEVRGVLYRSIAEAARQIGVSFSTLNSALDRGTQDKCGLSKRGYGLLDGVAYPSKAAAARALGISPQALDQRLGRGTITWTTIKLEGTR